MERTAREAYLEAQILTATPQKLRLMLIEGAITFARQTLRHWQEGRNEEAHATLIRCRRVVTELLSSIRDDQTQLTRTMSQLYLFLFRQVTQAHVQRDASTLQDVLRVLEEERVTWQEVCQRMPETPAEMYDLQPEEITAPAASAGDGTAGGFSLDA